MPTRVSPTEATIRGNQEMLTIISARPTTNDVPFIVDIQEQETANEPLLKAIDEIYSPLLKLMKLFGVYFGDAILKRLTHLWSFGKTHLHSSQLLCSVSQLLLVQLYHGFYGEFLSC